MNTAKHTPGPWVVSAGRVITTSSGQFYLTYGKDKHGNPLFKDFVELDNNTHLIAAAPAMYTLIKDMREAFYVNGTRKALLAVMERSHEIMAQAEGRA